MNALLYVAIWLSLALLALGELARSRPARTWARGASFIGWLLLVAHVLLAFEVVHGWQHSSALEATAQQTREIYGLDWGGGLYVNYAFLALWAGELWRWDAPAPSPARRLLWRGMVLILVSNGAIVFAVGWRRFLGGLITLALLWAWVRATRRAGAA
ncbi:MAG: hypothetical protein IPN34_15125 [Planctomycetes bacterium]|nr:hypothetical protein [Planctomycetota bacterium]